MTNSLSQSNNNTIMKMHNLASGSELVTSSRKNKNQSAGYYGTAKVLPILKNPKKNKIQINQAMQEDIGNYSIFAASKLSNVVSSEEISKRMVIPSLRMKSQEHFSKILKRDTFNKTNNNIHQYSLQSKTRGNSSQMRNTTQMQSYTNPISKLSGV